MTLCSDGRDVAKGAIDVSPRGMLILCDARVDPRERLLVRFQATDLSIWFATEATVARVVEGRRSGDAGRALGLRFESLSVVARLILRGHLKQFSLTSATRAVPPELAPDAIDYAAEVQRILES